MGLELEKLHPEFRALATQLLSHVTHLCTLSGVRWYVASTWRSPERQWELYKKGRRKVGVDWVREPGQSIVTRAKPDQTPHCVTLEGKPASCAVDIALVHEGPSGFREWLPAHDPRWSYLGTAVGLTGHQRLTWGGIWTSIRDFPHIELKNWKDLK